MSMANKAQFLIEILGDNVRAIKSIDEVTGKVNKLEGQTTGLHSIAGKLPGVFAALGAGIAVGAFGALIKQTIDLGDELNDMSKRSGVSVEQLSTLKYAAEQSGSSLEGVGTSLKFLNKNLYEASTGNKELVNAFNRLGVPAKDAAGNITSADQALYKIADKFKSMPDGVEKTALAMKVFERSGADIIPMLNDGAEGLMKMQQKAEKLGLQMSTKTAQEMDAFNDQLIRIKGSAQGAAVSFVSAFGSTMVSLLDNFAGGLDVIFGKIELINGIQFKNLGLSFVVINDQMNSLKNTTQEWRDVETDRIRKNIADMETYIPLLEKELEIENKIYMSGVGEVSLDKEKDEAKAQEIRNAKTLLEQEKQRLELIKGFGKATVENNFVTDESIKKNERLLKLEKDIQFKIDTAGLSEAFLKLANLKKEIDSFREQGINENVLSDYFWSQTESLRNMDAQKLFSPKNPQMAITPEIDTSKILSATDIIKTSLDDISFASRLNFEIMEGYGSEAFGSMADSLLSFANLTGNTNKSLFAMHKAFSVGQAIMNTYEGASKAIAQGGIFGGIMAASVIAMGLAQVAKIASTQPGSNTSGGGSSYSMPSIPRNTSSISNNNSTTNNARALNLTININSEVLAGDTLDKWVRDKLGPSIAKAADDGILNFGEN